jgi:acetyl esterase
VTLAPEARAYLDRLAEQGAPGAGAAPVPELRRLAEEGAPALFGPADPVASVVDELLPGPGGPLPVRVYEPSGSRPFGVLVYLHGGGWVTGSLDTHDGVCRALAARARCVVLSVAYRLAPEHRFPAALDDAWAALAWVAGHAASIGGDAARIAVGGDSAGGTLAAVTARRARDRGLPLELQLLVYPVLDASQRQASYDEFANGYGLTRDGMRWYWEQYLGPDADPADPDVSPLQALELSGLAPALVLTAENDPLRDEGEAYAARLTAAGVPVRLTRYGGQIHGFFRMRAIMPQADAALDEAAAALREALAPTAGTRGP